MDIPKFLYEMLLDDYDREIVCKIIDGYQSKPVTLRVNTLKTTLVDIKNKFDELGIKYIVVSWIDALILEDVTENDVMNLDIYQNGEIYLQSLSSMLPPLFLEPCENESILDMTAAPGGKTTEMACLSNNKALITACEKNKIRFERMKYNVLKQGGRIGLLNQDALKLDECFTFDKILLDAPCSGSGTLIGKESFLNITEELIENSCIIQEKLLRKAIKLLKKNGELVYSTCSILKKENEEVLRKVLKSNLVEIVPLELENFDLPMLPVTLPGTLCLQPTSLHEGFFVAKLRKK